MNHKQRQSGTRDAADRVRLKKINQVDAQGRCNEGARAAMAMKLRLFIAIIWARHPSLSRRGPDLNNILLLHLEIKKRSERRENARNCGLSRARNENAFSVAAFVRRQLSASR